MKKFIVAIVVCLITMLFTGCTTITIERRINKDSSIEDLVTVEFDVSVANSYGYSAEDVKLVIKDYMTANDYSIISVEENRVIGRKFYQTHAEFTESIPKGEDEDPITDEFFIDVYQTSSKPPFYTTLANGVDEKILSKCFEHVPQEALNEIKYEYKYTTPYSNVETNGEVSEKDGYYTHSWSWDKLGVEVGQVVITQTIPDRTGWYITAIVVSVAIVGAGYLIIGIIKGKGEEDDG